MRTLCIVLVLGCGPAEPTFAPNPDLAKPGFVIGGVVDGLRGKLTLSNNGQAELLEVDMAGPFAFFDRLQSGASYDVEVFQQPVDQTCTVETGQGTVAGADVTAVQVTCADSDHSIGGTVSGLSGMLVLRDDGADDLTLTMDGAFTFATRVADGAGYAVTVFSQPPAQVCKIQNGSGKATADVSDVSVTCQPSFAVGGTVSGLSGTVVLEDNGGDDLSLGADGSFSFDTRIADGAPYLVTVKIQPSGQRCDVTSGSGNVAGADVTSVVVTCQNVYNIGGTVTGMTAGTLVLSDNGGDNLKVTFPSTTFAFATQLASGANYDVEIVTQPTGQLCAVSANTGSVAGADVTSVSISCAPLQVRFDEIYARPGTGAYGDANGDGVRDSSDDEFVEIVNLEPNAVDISGWIIQSGNTGLTKRFTFPASTTLASGQRAVVFGGGTPTGSFGGALVFAATGSLSLTDSPTNPEQVVLDSLAGGARLDTYTYTKTTFGSSCTTKCASQTRDPGTGSFVGHTQLSGSPGILFSPGVSPDLAIAKIEGGFSNPPGGSTSASITGSITAQFNMFLEPADLDAARFQLFASTCTSPSNPTALSSVIAGSDATLVVLTPAANLQWAQPYCVVVSSTARSANDTPLGVNGSYGFTTVNPGPTFAIGGNIAGLTGTVVLQNESSDDLTVVSSGPYAFDTPWPDGSNYNITVKTQPAGQACTVDSSTPDPAQGQVPGRAVTVNFTCRNVHGLGGTVTGLQAGSLILLDNGGDTQTIPFGGPQSFTFTGLAEGDSYDVTVGTPPPTGQLCTVAAGSAVMGTSDVSLSVSCRTLDVVVAEIHPHPANGPLGDANGDGTRDSAADEFVEILNREAVPVDVTGWIIKVGAATPFTFAAGTTLQPGQRAVVFGNGSPSGSFGGALVFTGVPSLTDGGADVQLSSAASGGLKLQDITYSGCATTTCASLSLELQPSPSPQPATWTFYGGGITGVLWSPGTPASGAIPKLNPVASAPHGGATNVSVLTNLFVQFNMFMNSVGAQLHLFASSCAAPANEVPLFVSPNGSDGSSAWISPSPSPSPLQFATTYCVQADSTITNVLNVSLGTTQSYEFTTRAATSAPANSIVISEVGGCRLGTTGAAACATSVNNDEFVELYNPTAAAVDISGWSIQRRTAAGGTSCFTTLSSPSPSPAIIQPGGFFLVGGVGYQPSNYGGVVRDYPASPGTALTGVAESVVLLNNTASSCTTTVTTSVVDSISYGAVTETASQLFLPPLPGNISDGHSIERKACYNSTNDSDPTTSMISGTQSGFGNSEHIGGSNADWVTRPSPQPQGTTSAVEVRGNNCP